MSNYIELFILGNETVACLYFFKPGNFGGNKLTFLGIIFMRTADCVGILAECFLQSSFQVLYIIFSYLITTKASFCLKHQFHLHRSLSDATWRKL